MFVLFSGKFVKKLDLSSLIHLIDEETRKESKIIKKVKESKSQAIEEEKAEYPIIDYTKLTLSDIAENLELRGLTSFTAVLIRDCWRIEKVIKMHKGCPLDKPLAGKTLRDLAATEDFVVICCKEIVGIETKGILLLDGTIYNTDNTEEEKASDPINLFQELLLNTSTSYGKESEMGKKCAETLREKILMNIEGDFAFVYLDLASHLALLGKDRLGKKSLLLHDQIDSLGQLCISSISFDKANYKEIIGNTLISLEPDISKCYIEKNPCNISSSRFSPINPITNNEELLEGLKNVLTIAIKRRIKPTSKTAILFSGGIDSLLLAYLAHEVIPAGQE
eukprot:TRINITY_DN6248_c0_g2_i11.p1 TRINITY_DN6248_c0_g2~~TRINITY_DN6248_c0_g2_i11.p1  ORF type:complete len:336 (+),score=45.82 TRINITY_DN6248_c0_g2_i11:160-1167(+)